MLLAVAEVSHVCEPFVEYVAYVVVFGVGLAAYRAGECVVSVYVKWL